MRKYGLIGFPLEHSFSKSYFEKKFNKLQIKNVNYENYELDNINHLNNLIEKFPSNLIARIFKFKKAEFFEIHDSEEREVPETL